MKMISCKNQIYSFNNNKKLISDGVTFVAFVYANDDLTIDEIQKRTQSIIDEFYDQNIREYNDYNCVCFQCEKGILINYQLDEDYPNENAYKEFLKEVKSLLQIQNDFADSIKNFKKLYLAYYSPTTIRSFEYSKNMWKQIAIKDGYA